MGLWLMQTRPCGLHSTQLRHLRAACLYRFRSVAKIQQSHRSLGQSDRLPRFRGRALGLPELG